MHFRDRPDLVGVVGGMGPLAGADYMTKVIELSPGVDDADHVPMIVCSCPQIPERVPPIVTGEGESPLPALIERVRFLVDAGCKVLTMPCNTAHFWYDEMAAAGGVPFIHIADAAISALKARNVPKGPVGLIGTKGTIKAKIYEPRLAAAGYDCVPAPDAVITEFVLPGIKCVKRNKIDEGAVLFEKAVRHLLDETKVPIVLLACTEVPVGLAGASPALWARMLDPNAALAQATVDWALAQR